MSLKSKIESILFVSEAPISVNKLSKILDVDKTSVIKALEELYNDYIEQKRGIRIIRHEEKYQLVTSPENSKIVNKFLNIEINSDFTKPALETLSIIAYRGPISKAELELIRGVNCSLILRNLLIKGLIEKVISPKDNLPRYKITLDFLKYLGISDVRDLPDYEHLNSNEILQKLLYKNN